MTPPAARRRSQFIDAVIDEYAAAHSTPPDAGRTWRRPLRSPSADALAMDRNLQLHIDSQILTFLAYCSCEGNQMDGANARQAPRPSALKTRRIERNV